MQQGNITPAAAGSFTAPSPWSDSSGLEQVKLAHLYEGSAFVADAPVDRSSAMSLSAVSKARHILTGTISRFPLVIMQGNEQHKQPAAWAEQPEDGRTRSQTILWTVDALIFYGRAWWVITDRYADGLPRRFALIPEGKAQADENGFLQTAYGVPVAPQDYIRFDAPHEGVLNFGARTLRKALATERAAENAAANPVPSVELHQVDGDDMSREEIQELLNQWRRARSANGGGVSYSNKTLEVRTHGQPAEQLLIDAQNQAAINVARMMGLPAWAVDAVVAGSSLNYSNSPSRARELIDFGLMPYMTAITDRLSMDDVLPRGTWVRFEEADLVAPPLRERLEAYRIAIDAGIYTAQEVRSLLHGIPLESKGETTDGNQGNHDSSRAGNDGSSSTEPPDDYGPNRNL